MLIQNGNEVFRELSIREIFGCDVIVRPDILGGGEGRGGKRRESGVRPSGEEYVTFNNNNNNNNI